MVTCTKYAMGHKSAIMYLTITLANRSIVIFHVREKIFYPYAGLQVCPYSGYDLCHPGYIAYRQTQSDRLTDKQTDSY